MSANAETPSGQVFDPMWTNTPTCRQDLREISTGHQIPTRFYADQPYLTPTGDGGLLCVVTTGLGHEGARGQHVISMKTFDFGKTWQDIVAVESSEKPESSWGVPFTAPNGRIFVFYVYNADDLRELPADDPPYPGGWTQRMDSHGYYVFRWSDDHGKTWSQNQGTIPVREFEIDRQNPTGGKVRLFWNVGKAFSWNDSLYLPIHKVGGFGDGWFTSSEGALLRSSDLFTLTNPLDASWSTLPDTERGIRAPKDTGPIAEEHSFVSLSDGTFFTVFRTIDGHPACAYSRDYGASWEPSNFMRFANGNLIKHPRAANFVWKKSDGAYLYCFHNHGGKYLREHPTRRSLSYVGRNPMWLCRGWETDGPNGKILEWSEPEIILYDDDPMVRISYPDYIEIDGKLFLTETQKSIARIHRIPQHLVHALSASPENRAHALHKILPLLEWNKTDASAKIPMPRLPAFSGRNQSPPYGAIRTREGFAIHLIVRIQKNTPAILASNHGKDGSGLQIAWTSEKTLHLRMCDGSIEVTWESDPVEEDGLYTFTINVDGGSNTICFYRDGILNDGGQQRQYGWGRIHPYFRNEYSGKNLIFPEQVGSSIESLTIYTRILTSAEVQFLVGKEDLRVLTPPEPDDISMIADIEAAIA